MVLYITSLRGYCTSGMGKWASNICFCIDVFKNLAGGHDSAEKEGTMIGKNIPRRERAKNHYRQSGEAKAQSPAAYLIRRRRTTQPLAVTYPGHAAESSYRA